MIALALGAAAGLALLLTSPLHKRTAITSWVALAAFTLVGAFSRLALMAQMARPAAILQGIADLGIVAVSLHALIAVLFRLVLMSILVGVVLAAIGLSADRLRARWPTLPTLARRAAPVVLTAMAILLAVRAIGHSTPHDAAKTAAHGHSNGAR